MPPAAAGKAGFALALGGGGARGLAHIGVLKVLAEEGLRPSAVAGTSMGAIVGALFAAGHGAGDLETLVGSLGLKDYAAVTGLRLGRGSVLTADRIEEGLRAMLPATFEELPLPYAAVAADLVTGERVVMSSGDLPQAVRASMSVPIVFEPVRLGEMLLVDGGIVDPVPVEAARGLVVAPVIAVDVGTLVPGPEGADAQGPRRLIRKPGMDATAAPNVIQVGTRSFDVMQHWIAERALANAAVVIAPAVGSYVMADFLEASTLVKAGEDAAREALPAIRETLAAEAGFGGWLRRLMRG